MFSACAEHVTELAECLSSMHKAGICAQQYIDQEW